MALNYGVSFTFSPNTTIQSSQVNTNFSDNSNTWNGLEGKTKTISNLGVDTELKSGGTIKSADGTAGAPAITFTSELTTGFYRNGTGVIGVGTGNKITGIANGSAASDVAAFGQIPVFTDWTLYTPTVTGCGTITGTNFYYHQMGNHIFVKGYFQCGTPSGSNFSISLPVNMSLSHTPAFACLGVGFRYLTAVGPTTNVASAIINMFNDGSTNNVLFGTMQSGNQAPTKVAGSLFFGTTDAFGVSFDYAI